MLRIIWREVYFRTALHMPMWLSRYHWWWTFVGNARAYFEARPDRSRHTQGGEG